MADVGPGQQWRGEQWPERSWKALIITRTALWSGWFALGPRLGAARPDRFVLGWEVRRSLRDFPLLVASSRLGLEGEVLGKRRQHTLLVATWRSWSLDRSRSVGRRRARHRQVVRHLLKQASCRQGEKERDR